MNEVILDVELRTVSSRGNLAKLRKDGKIPAVLYGKDIKPELIAVNSKTFISILRTNGTNVIIDLNFKDNRKAVIVKALQEDVLTQNLIHIDFQAISLKNKVEVFVPIHVNGVADGVKKFGGVMEFMLREIKIEALPVDIPKKISIDVSSLKIGDGISISDLAKIDGVKYVQDPSTLIVHVVPITIEEEKSDITDTKIIQPEVISKGKKDQEGGEELSISSGIKK
jgi:large subunit ribosomal protein L25